MTRIGCCFAGSMVLQGWGMLRLLVDPTVLARAAGLCSRSSMLFEATVTRMTETGWQGQRTAMGSYTFFGSLLLYRKTAK